MPETLLESSDLAQAARQLTQQGFIHFSGRWPSWDSAKCDSFTVMAAAEAGDPLGLRLPTLAPVGEFRVPPSGPPGRNFQALHIDFGWPLAAQRPVDVARFTALHIDADRASSEAVTRIVPLRPLLGQRPWLRQEALAERLHRSAGPERSVEGILGRLVEILDETTSLPASSTPGFLCGMEFSSAIEEDHFFRSHGVDLSKAERRVVLRSGEVLVLDNLRTAHGRLGRRNTGELRQLFVGYRALSPERQRALLERILAAFGPYE